MTVLNVGYFSEPAANARLNFLPLAFRVITVTGYWIAIVGLALVTLHSIRQLVAVSRLHAAATSIDIFEPGAVTAFSRLTSATAIGIVVLSLPYVLQTGTNSDSPFSVAVGLFFLAMAVTAFVVPPDRAA